MEYLSQNTLFHIFSLNFSRGLAAKGKQVLFYLFVIFGITFGRTNLVETKAVKSIHTKLITLHFFGWVRVLAIFFSSLCSLK